MSAQAGRYQRSSTGMVGALLVLLTVVLGFVAFRELNRADLERPVSTVDYRAIARDSQEQASFDLLVPSRLDPGWRATSARFDSGNWHLGLLTGEDRYVGLEQSTRPLRTVVATYVAENAVRAGEVTVAGEAWQVWDADDGDQGLVRAQGGVTTLVVGTADQDDLTGLISRLG